MEKKTVNELRVIKKGESALLRSGAKVYLEEKWSSGPHVTLGLGFKSLLGHEYLLGRGWRISNGFKTSLNITMVPKQRGSS